jgi:hypothetical protein
MCQECYARWEAEVTYTGQCKVCGGYLEGRKMESFRAQPNELRNRLHEGRCLDYFALLSCKALGQDMSFIRDELCNYGRYGEEELDLGSRQDRHGLLPPPSRQLRLQSGPDEELCVPSRSIRSTYKGKKVMVIAVRTRDQGY